MKKFILGALFCALIATGLRAQLTQQGNETRITGCTGSSCTLVTPNLAVNPNLLVSTGTNTFLLGVAPSNNAARIYITNDTANSCANLTVTIASTGNSAVTSFNNSPQAWQAISVQSGTGSFASSAAITLPASGTVAITSKPIVGTQVAIFVVLSSGCNTTNVDMQVVFGQFSVQTGAVQGVVAVGGAASGENPVFIGYKDAVTGNIGAVQGINGGINIGGTNNGIQG